MRDTVVILSHPRYINGKEMIFHTFITNDLNFGEKSEGAILREAGEFRQSIVLGSVKDYFGTFAEAKSRAVEMQKSVQKVEGNFPPVVKLKIRKFIPYGTRGVAKVQTKLRKLEEDKKFNSWIK